MECPHGGGWWEERPLIIKRVPKLIHTCLLLREQQRLKLKPNRRRLLRSSRSGFVVVSVFRSQLTRRPWSVICAKKLMMIMRIIFVILIMLSSSTLMIGGAARSHSRDRLPLKEDQEIGQVTAGNRHEAKRRKASGKLKEEAQNIYVCCHIRGHIWACHHRVCKLVTSSPYSSGTHLIDNSCHDDLSMCWA